jgi:integrase/recombinase XerC/integrase/recombinase XerD
MTADAAGSTDSEVRATVWLRPDQVDDLRSACYRDDRAAYLRQRDDAIVTLMYDAGLRVGELVALDVDHLRDDATALYLPTAVQKDYPTDGSPPPTRVGLADDTTRTLRGYLSSRWRESPALFPSRSSDRISTRAVRSVVDDAAEAVGVRPYRLDGSRGEPADVSPHALRHSVAWRMLHAEDGNTLYDVRNRLRHRSIQTTERVYDHFQTV